MTDIYETFFRRYATGSHTDAAHFHFPVTSVECKVASAKQQKENPA
jgi:hypothetical protein